MCLAVPMRIESIENTDAIVELAGVKRQVSIVLLEDKLKPGDHVIVHAGFAIQKLDEEDASERLKYLEEMLEME